MESLNCVVANPEANRRFRGGTIPPISDPRWSEWAAPLRDSLVEPKNWALILEWGRKNRQGQKIIRHLLAWLEEEGQITSFSEDEVFYWVKLPWRAKLTEAGVEDDTLPQPPEV